MDPNVKAFVRGGLDLLLTIPYLYFGTRRLISVFVRCLCVIPQHRSTVVLHPVSVTTPRQALSQIPTWLVRRGRENYVAEVGFEPTFSGL